MLDHRIPSPATQPTTIDDDGELTWAFEQGQLLRSVALPNQPPDLLGWEQLGVGFRCETWLCWSPKRWLPVVVKVPRPHQLGHPRARASLEREARVLSQTAHPALPALFEDGTSAHCPYVVTEYVDGVALDEELEGSGPLDGESAAVLAAHLISAVLAVHATGHAHLDVKPENVMLRDGRPVLVDLGSSRPLGSPQPPGRPVGTVGYAAPEMEDCRPVNTSMDVYGIGVVLAEVLGFPVSETHAPTTVIEARVHEVASAMTGSDPLRRVDLEGALRLLDEAVGPGRLWPTWALPSHDS